MSTHLSPIHRVRPEPSSVLSPASFLSHRLRRRLLVSFKWGRADLCFGPRSVRWSGRKKRLPFLPLVFLAPWSPRKGSLQAATMPVRRNRPSDVLDTSQMLLVPPSQGRWGFREAGPQEHLGYLWPCLCCSALLAMGLQLGWGGARHVTLFSSPI